MMKIDRRPLFSFDWLLFLAVMALAGAGIVAIWSSTEGTGINSYFGRQVIYLCLAVFSFLVLLYFDYHVFSDFITFIYAVAVAVLLLVLLIGQSIHASKSWIDLGPFAFQPSELMKVVVVVALAKYYSESEGDHLNLNELFFGGLIVFVPMALVMLQGDLGTAVTFLPIYMGLSFLAGIKRKHVVVMLIAVLLAAPLGWIMLKDYQKGRIETVINPYNDPKNLGYQTIQSEIAIGSGQFFGKGFKRGSQGQLGFLPARHTDFVFAVLSEERGFVGSIGILSIFLLVCLLLIRAAREAKDKLGTMIVTGVLSVILFHLTVNVGMVVGLLPIVGIPLPFISAGGSSLISCFIAMSLCMNVRIRRYIN